MGQSHSSKEVVPRGPPPRPTSPPSAKLISDLGPKGPKIHKPENKVLPTVLPNTRQLLRPVSQELSEVHPDYKDIFAYDDDDGEDIKDNNDKENVQTQMPNGNVPHSNGGINISNGHVPRNSDTNSVVSSGSSASSGGSKYRVHRRQQSASSSLYTRENTILEDPEESLEKRGKLDPLSTSCPQVSIPIKSSFNIDSSMNMTYVQLAEARRNKTLSMIEQKTGKKIDDLSSDLSEHTSRPAVNLVRSHSTKTDHGAGGYEPKKKKRAPAPPTQMPPAPPLTARSAPNTPKLTKSKSAPPRPLSPPVVPSYSFDNEPPADYDVESPRSSPTRQIFDSRAISPTRRHSKPRVTSPSRQLSESHVISPSPELSQPNIPAPPPPPGILRKTSRSSTPHSHTDSVTDYPGKSALTRTNSQRIIPSPEPKVQDSLLLEIQKLAENKALRRQMSENAEKDQPVFDGANIIKRTSSTSADDAEVKNPMLQRQDSVQEIAEPQVPSPVTEKTSSILERKNSTASSSSTTSSKVSSKASEGGATRRLSSLLQHDIKIAAQAKATKMVKKQTPVKEKPKDPAEVFREQLQKAAADRKTRNVTSSSIDEEMKNKRASEIMGAHPYEEETTVFKNDAVTVKKTPSILVKKEGAMPTKESKSKDKKMESSENKTVEQKSAPKEIITLDQEDLQFPRHRYEKRGSTPSVKDSVSGRSSVVKNSRQRAPDLDDDSKTATSEEWTPEHDLESDDDLSDRETMTSRKSNSEGFKSSIIPNKVNDLKSKGGKGKNKYEKKSCESDERKKYDSIKRFKKSVHKSVMNAFGSISKASGKLTKRGKSEDLEKERPPPPPPPSNWKLSASNPDLLKDDQEDVRPKFEKRHSLQSERALKYMVSNGYGDHDSESSDEEEEQEAGETKVSSTNEEGHHPSDSEESEEEISSMKRAGVAYVGKKGQIVVLPEFEKVQVSRDGKIVNDFEGHAPKIYQKKKKFTFDATVRKKERERKEELLSEEVKEKEKHREAERQTAMQTEAEYQKMRELEARREKEARERLQRLETQAQIQQQLLQQQQQQQLGIMTVPPLPPPSGFQQGYNPAIDYSQILAAQTGLGQAALYGGSQPMFSGPVYPGMPSMTYDLAEYMRMMGMAGTPSPNTPQQYAFMFNSVNWANQGLMDHSKFYPTKSASQEYLDSDRNQVFNNWVGPAKQPASKANVIISSASQGSLNSTNNNQFGANSVYVNGVSTTVTPSGGSSKQRTNIMINDDESDTSDGLSPQKTDASLANLQTKTEETDATEGEHKTKISVTSVYVPSGYKRQTSFSSVSSQPGSENSAER